MYLWHVEHQNVAFLRLWGMLPYVAAGCFFRTLLNLAQQTMQRLLPVAARERLGCCCPTPCKRLLGMGFTAVDCCVVVTAGRVEHVEGANAVAGTRVGSVGIHDYVGVVDGPNEELHEESGCSCPRLPCTCNKRQS